VTSTSARDTTVVREIDCSWSAVSFTVTSIFTRPLPCSSGWPTTYCGIVNSNEYRPSAFVKPVSVANGVNPMS